MTRATPENPIRRSLETDRGVQSVYDFGGPNDAPLFHFAHANGFNGLTYRRILAPLTDQFRVLAWDARGHGFSDLPADPKRLTSWGTYREDLSALIVALDEPVYLGGHSLGGAGSIMACGKLPERVLGLVLIEPVMPPAAFSIVSGISKVFGLDGLNPMARAALKRRSRFPDHASMADAYVGRGAFKTWDRSVIEDYVRGGAKPAADGVTLACTREWEAATFSSLPEHLIPAFSRIKCPAVLLAGEVNSTAPAGMTVQAKLFCPQLDIHRIPGSSHFLPMERPDLVVGAARAVRAGRRFNPAVPDPTE